MNGFLYSVSDFLYNKYEQKISDFTIVFPNRRAGVFFTKYLSQVSEKTMWMPQIFTINEFAQKLSNLQLADKLTLIFELYKSYKSVYKTSENFDDFYLWGEMLLNDFDDIDKYLINPDDVFQNISSVKDLDYNFDYLSDEQIKVLKQFFAHFYEGQLSDKKESFLKIWNVLNPIYKDFNKNLSQKLIAYEGMIYRKMFDKIKDNTIEINSEKIIFIGFNALNNCENELFNFLQNNKLAEFYWDYDNYYTKNNKQHEAGLFLRKNINKFKNDDFPFNYDNLISNKNIEIISSPSDVSQTKIVSQILEENNFVADKTAIVLADENLLVPLLFSLPDKIAEINVTMGYPLKNTPVFSLIKHIISLQKNAKKDKNNNTVFYHSDISNILNHQYINYDEQSDDENIIDKIKVYCSLNNLQNPLLAKIFVKIDEFDNFSNYITEVLYEVLQNITNDNENKNSLNLEIEYIYHIFIAVKRLNEVIASEKIDLKIETYFKLFDKVIQSLSVPFTGEPLAGLQIMGVLETRVLDFENVIILSMNEGVLPKSGIASSFIPYNIRKGFGLPTIENQDAVYAYYFYRLIQRAQNVFMVYNTQSSGITANEKSRFLYQLKYEHNFNIIEKNLTFDIGVNKAKKITIEKNPDIINKLNLYLSSGEGRKSFSPSALNVYKSCSLKFYFKYIAGLKQVDELVEDIDAMHFGSITHEAIHLIYQNFKDEKILVTKDELDQITKNKTLISNAIKKAFNTQYFKVNEDAELEIKGKDLLIFEIIKRYVNKIIDTDKNKFAPFSIIDLEKSLNYRFPVVINKEKKFVNFYGKIDRIDQLNSSIRIIDYKTGSEHNSFYDVEEIFDNEKSSKTHEIFQIFMYSMLFEKNFKPNVNIEPCLFYIKKLYNKNFNLNINQKQKKKIVNVINSYNLISGEFESKLSELIVNVFDENINFEQTEDSDRCKYCEYADICKRN
ncbi:MAG: PD-(D/E)XK nuclease family protein [Bacteroidetes bacterium]|nr:PD-(D/E)XK nuclease family protein [Bacteroidota bacterium]